MPPPPSRRPGAGRAVTADTYSLMSRKKIRCDCIPAALAVGGGYLRIQAHHRCRFGSFFFAVVVFLSITQLKSVGTNGRHPKRCCAVRCFFSIFYSLSCRPPCFVTACTRAALRAHKQSSRISPPWQGGASSSQGQRARTLARLRLFYEAALLCIKRDSEDRREARGQAGSTAPINQRRRQMPLSLTPAGRGV